MGKTLQQKTLQQKTVSNGGATFLEIWEMRSILSLPLLPGPL